MSSLWGELPPVPKITTPAKILSEQAAELQQATKGIIVGDVSAVTPRYVGGGVAHELRAYVPALNNYTLRLLLVEHGVLSYPCHVINLRTNAASQKLLDEEGFVAWLEDQLHDPDLMKLFANLMAQVQAIG
jgi:hypothetical protein